MTKFTITSITTDSSIIVRTKNRISTLRSMTSKILCAALLLCAMSNSAFAITYITRASGDVNDLNNWEDIDNPTSTPFDFSDGNDTWIIKDAMTAFGNWSVEGNLTIDASGSLAEAGTEIYLGGSFANYGDISNTSYITFTSGHGGNVIEGDFTTYELYYLRFDNPNGEWAIHAPMRVGSLVIAYGTVTGPSGLTIEVTANWFNGGNFIHNGSTVRFSSGTGPRSLDGNMTGSSAFGNLVINSGAWLATANIDAGNFSNINAGFAGVIPITLKISSDFVNSGNFDFLNVTTVEFNGTTQNISGVTTFKNVLFSNPGDKTVSDDITIDQSLNISSDVVLDMTTASLSGAGTFTNNGTIKTQNTTSTPIPSGKTWGGTVVYDNITTDQNVADGTYNNLTVGGATGAVTYNAANPIVVNGTLMTTLSTTTLNLGANPLTGTLSGVVNNGTIRSQDGSTAPLPPGKTWGGTVYLDDFLGRTRYVVAGTYNNLSIDENGVAAGDFSVDSTFWNLSPNFDMRTYQLGGLLSLQGAGGSFKTQNTSATPVPAGVDWRTMIFIYNHPSATQTIVAGTYDRLTPGTAAVTNHASGDIRAVVLTISAGVTFDMGTYALLGVLSGPGSGTLLTQNTSSTPIPAGGTWGCSVVYNATANQTVVRGNYSTNLTVGGASGTATYTASGNVRVNGVLTTALSTTTLDMSTFSCLALSPQLIIMAL